MKTKLKLLMLVMGFIYICAILIDTNLNPLEWSVTLRYFSVILFSISGLILLMVDSESLNEVKEYDAEPDHEWHNDLMRGK